MHPSTFRSLRCCRLLHTSSPARMAAGRGPPGQPQRAQRLKAKPRAQPVQPLPISKPPAAGNESKPPAAARSEYDTAEAIFKARRIPLLAAGVVALGCGLYCTLMVSSFLQSSSVVDGADPTGRPPGFSRESAHRFDQSLDASEKTMGVTELRERLGQRASGHVLEVALGTGRNLSFYDWSKVAVQPSAAAAAAAADAALPLRKSQGAIDSFTGVDVSSDMLGVAIDKLPGAIPSLTGDPLVATKTLPSSPRNWRFFSYLGGKIRITQCDIQEALPPPEPELTPAAKYDTVVQTFGLCSVADPERVVQNLASAVKPGTGRIILIEHGQSWWRVVNALLDWSAASHFQKYGCWWNRDIVGIVERVVEATPGLQIVQVERPFITQLGTTVWIELQVAQP